MQELGKIPPFHIRYETFSFTGNKLADTLLFKFYKDGK